MSKKVITEYYEAVVFNFFYTERAMRCAMEVDVISGRVDVMAIKDHEYTCIEVKTSVQDFRSKNGHNFIGHKNYYAMPRMVYEKVKDKIPKHIGVYTVEKGDWGRPKLVCIKNARKVDMEGHKGKYRNMSVERYQAILFNNFVTALNSNVNRLTKERREKWKEGF